MSARILFYAICDECEWYSADYTIVEGAEICAEQHNDHCHPGSDA